MFGAFAKLCQRQVYSWLSSRCGLTICVVGVFLVLVSALQFGEVSGWHTPEPGTQRALLHVRAFVGFSGVEQRELCSSI